MKRLVLTITGTVASLAALLSFKTHSQPLADTATHPAASLNGQGSGSITTTPTTRASSGATKPANPSAASSSASAATTKTYLGSSIATRYGIIQVKITVRGTTITHVSFAQLTAFDGRSQQINSYAAPQLLQETLTAQSARVDTVSGASYTSDGYRQSLQSALDKAGI